MDLKLAHQTRPRPGETLNGDAVWIRRTETCTWFAVIDGTGHGPEAAAATRLTIATLEASGDEEAIERLLQVLDRELRGTRGVALTLCRFADGILQGAGVGNVELHAQGSPVQALLTPGILGRRVARLRTFHATLRRGDRLVVWSDGISARVAYALSRDLPTETACAELLASGARATDDATVLVADVIETRAARHEKELTKRG